MIRLLLGLACAATLATAGCSPKKITLKKIGEACAEDADCGSELCHDKLCTRICAAQAECPLGFDCGQDEPGHTEGMCYKARYNPAEAISYGVNCGVIARGCGMPESPCAAGFDCQATVKCGANSFCSKACAGDADCPPFFFCATYNPCPASGLCETYAPGDTPLKVCAPRRDCADCLVNDQCPLGYVCAANKSGRGCSKTCKTDEDCPPVRDFEPFQKCVKGTCQNTNGYCSGKSTLPKQMDGGVCAPCRIGYPEDCKLPDSFCYQSEFTGERFCTVECTVKVSGNKVTSDSCTAIGGAICNSIGSSLKGICAANPKYGSATCYP